MFQFFFLISFFILGAMHQGRTSLYLRDHAAIGSKSFTEKVEGKEDYKALKERLSQIEQKLQTDDLTKLEKDELGARKASMIKQMSKIYRSTYDKDRRSPTPLVSLLPISPIHINQKASAREFSGALEWAHLKSLTGKGVKVIALEASGTLNHVDLEKCIVHQKCGNEDSHGAMVAGVLREIAPAANISILPREFILTLKNIRSIVNYSAATTNHYTKLHNMNAPFTFLKNNPHALLVVAAGNEGTLVLRSGYTYTTSTGVEEQISKNTSFLGKERLIMAGSIGRDYKISSFSSDSPDFGFHDNFLYTLGENVLAPIAGTKYAKEYGMGNVLSLGAREYDLRSGTSLAAPIIAGAAALIRSKYQDFSSEEIQQVLLESADRTFLTGENDFFSKKKIYVVNQEDFSEEELELFLEVCEKENLQPREFYSLVYRTQVPYEPCSPYGKGILNVRNAFIYAEILNRQKSRGQVNSPQAIRKEMIAQIREEQEKMAATIQRAYRKHKSNRKE